MKAQIITLVLFFASLSFVAEAQKSPRKQSDGTTAGINVAIDYSAPSVKGRKVWGGLESYGKVWRAGADKNTTVSLDKDAKLGGQDIPAGKYGFFIIPKKEGDWIVIFNKKNDGWGAYSYNEKEDALRLNVTPEWSEENQEQLSYSVSASGVVFAWEKVRLTIPVGG